MLFYYIILTTWDDLILIAEAFGALSVGSDVNYYTHHDVLLNFNIASW